MIASVVAGEAKEVDPPDPAKWLAGGRPIAEGVQRAFDNVVPLKGPVLGLKTRADFTSDLDYELYMWQRELEIMEDQGLSVTPAQSASVEYGSQLDDRERLDAWLANAAPRGYTSLIKTRAVMDPALDVLEVYGKSWEAPQRMKRVRVPNGNGKYHYELRRDRLETRETGEMVEHVIRWVPESVPFSGERKISTWRPEVERTGQTGLRTPFDCTFVWIGEFNQVNLQRAKRRHADRQAESRATRKRFGKADYRPPEVGEGSLVRRPPTVAWFCRNPDGRGKVYEEPYDEAFPGIVDPRAVLKNGTHNKRASEATVRPGQIRYRAEENLRFEVELKSELKHKQALAEYASEVRSRDGGYTRPEEVYRPEELLSAPDLPLGEDTGKFHGPMNRSQIGFELKHISVMGYDWRVPVAVQPYAPEEIWNGKEYRPAETEVLEGEYIPAGEEIPVPQEMSSRDRNLQKLAVKALEKTLNSHSLVPVEMGHWWEYHLTGGYYKVPLDNPACLPILDAIIRRLDRTYESVLLAKLTAHRLQGGALAWDDCDVNPDGLLDDQMISLDIERLPREMTLADLGVGKVHSVAEWSARRRAYIPCAAGRQTYSRAAYVEQKHRVGEKMRALSKVERRSVTRALFRNDSIRDRMAKHRERVKHAMSAVEREKRFLRYLRINRLNQKAFVHKRVSSEGDRADYAVMQKRMKNPRWRKLKRKASTFFNRFRPKRSGESVPTPQQIPPIIGPSDKVGTEFVQPVKVPYVSEVKTKKAEPTPDVYHNERGRPMEDGDIFLSEKDRLLAEKRSAVVYRMHGGVIYADKPGRFVHGDYESRTGDLIRNFLRGFQNTGDPFFRPEEGQVITSRSVPLKARKSPPMKADHARRSRRRRRAA